MEREKIINLFLIFLIAVSAFLILFQNFSIQGLAVDTSTQSNVSIFKSIAISFSTNLSNGIIFPDVHFLPSYNTSASHNFDSNLNGTGYYISISPDSNTQVSLCLKASGGMNTTGGDVIGLGNETYATYPDITNSSLPSINSKLPMNTTYYNYQSTISPGSTDYMRFWLDVPAGQASGSYSNLVYFKAVSIGNLC